MVNDNWKSQGPSYQLPARDVGFSLLGRRFSADTQSVSIKISHPGRKFWPALSRSSTQAAA